MPSFSSSSMSFLRECHPQLQKLFLIVVENYDCKVLEGYRSPSRQDLLHSQGQSRVKGGDSAHNYSPSLAIDIAPYPIPKNWGGDSKEEYAKFYHFAFYVRGVADALGISIRWGGDWDGDNDVTDQHFNDLVHFELSEWRSYVE